MTAHCIYLHGFASGPSSTKAQFFQEKLKSVGVEVSVPDLNGSNFSDLTISGQLEIVRAEMERIEPSQPLLLFGSSMGGLLATLAAGKSVQPRGLILLAPGFGLNRRWTELLGLSGLEQWQESGEIEVFHYGYGKNVPLKYAFIEDAMHYQTDNLVISIPSLVIHGRNDETVPVSESEMFAQRNQRSVELHVLDADHSLVEPLPLMWNLVSDFLARLPGFEFVKEEKRAL